MTDFSTNFVDDWRTEKSSMFVCYEDMRKKIMLRDDRKNWSLGHLLGAGRILLVLELA